MFGWLVFLIFPSKMFDERTSRNRDFTCSFGSGSFDFPNKPIMESLKPILTD